MSLGFPPLLCSVCVSRRADCVVPERSEEWLFHDFCTLCLDELVSCFPIKPRDIYTRELTGVYHTKKRYRRRNLRRGSAHLLEADKAHDKRA